MPRQSLRRRQFLGMGAAATLGGTAVSCSKSNGGRWRFFTPAEALTAAAVCEQIIPADQDPGARDAGVVNYIDLQLTKHFKQHGETYRKGLAAVDSISQSKHGCRFVDLAFDAQPEVLKEVQKQAKPFFELILAHTMQGFYGDPRHGGNRDAVSWKMLALPYPPVRGRGTTV
jgi:gluconate 2-dehydrogenase gamma chain